MKSYQVRLVLLVYDYDEALAFYQQNFNCRVLFDKPDEKGTRFLHIGFDNTDNIRIWLLKNTTGKEQLPRKLISGQPALVVHTDNILWLYYHLQKTIQLSLYRLSIHRNTSFLIVQPLMQ